MEDGRVWVCRLFALYSTTKGRCGVFILVNFIDSRSAVNPAARRHRPRILLR
ncbi:hypothetical protein GGE62_006959 [Rhizobium leguminosarum]|nr:hypothetical protein [Rhizobium leguminosarum]